MSLQQAKIIIEDSIYTSLMDTKNISNLIINKECHIQDQEQSQNLGQNLDQKVEVKVDRNLDQKVEQLLF